MDMEIDLPLEPSPPSPVPDGGLPYDAPPSSSITARLDAALPTPRDPGEVGESTKELMGRMSEHKIYTFEDNAEDIYKPAVEDDDEEDIDLSFLEDNYPSHPLRPLSLHLSGPPLSHLPTPLIFTFTSLHLPSPPSAIEWIDDTSCLLLFPSESSAFQALKWLSKTGFDPETDDPVGSLPAWGVPTELFPKLPGQEEEKAEEEEEVLGREAFEPKKPKRKPKAIDPEDLPEGMRPGARLNIRYGLLTDIKAKRPGRESNFYKTYGTGAGGKGRGRVGKVEGMDIDGMMKGRGSSSSAGRSLHGWDREEGTSSGRDLFAALSGSTSTAAGSGERDWKKARDEVYGGYEDIGGERWGRDGGMRSDGWEAGPATNRRERQARGAKTELLGEGGAGLLGRLGPAMDRERSRSPRRWEGRERERSPVRGGAGRDRDRDRDSGRREKGGRGKREVKDQAALDRELDEFLGRA